MLDKLMFNGAPVLVTGAAAGIGRSCCEAFADLGARVLAVDVNGSFVEDEHLTSRGASWPHEGFQTDVSIEAQVQALRKSISARYDGLAAVVNIVGLGPPGLISEMPLASWSHALDVSLSSMFLMTRELFPLVAAGEGSFVNMSSSYGLASRAGRGAYSAAKGGVIAFTRTVAIEGAPVGVRANCVCPGPVSTPRREAKFSSGEESRQAAAKRTLLGRLADPSEIASLIAFLASKAASYMTGAAVVIDGGQLVHIGEVS